MPSVMRQINVISRCASMFREKNSEKSLAGIYHSYAFYLHKNHGVSQDMLAKHLCLNKSSVTRHLSFLENEGYIIRKPNPSDKREMLVYPTEKFDNELYPDILEVSRKWREKVLSDLSEEEKEKLLVLLEKLAERSKEAVLSEGGEK